MSIAGANRLLSALLLFSCFILFQPFLSMRTAAAQSEKPFVLRSEVELVAVEVAALDKNGRPVKNLKKESFKLYEDGKQQEIVSFDEVTAGQGTPSPQNMALLDDNARRGGKTVLILFDDGALSAENVKRARDSAALFVKDHMNSQDWFAAASFGYSLTLLQNLTNEPEKILKAIAQPAISATNFSSKSDGSTASLPGTGAPRDLDIGMASMNYQSEGFLSALQAINYSIERLKGQKSVLIYSQSNFINPKTVEKVYKAVLTSAKRANVVYYTVDPGGLTLTQPSPWDNNNINSGTVTSTSTSSSSSSSSSTSPSAAAAAQGAQTSSAGSADSLDSQASQNIAGQSGGGGLSLLKALASDTGGSSIFNTNKYDSELANLDLQLSNYYILGFSSNNPKRNGELRKLTVKIDQKGIALKHRNAYLDRRPVDMLSSSKREGKLMDALASPASTTRLPVSFRPAYFYDSSRLSRVLVFAEIGMEKAAIKKNGDQLESDLSVMGVAYAEDGSISGRFSETLNTKFEKETEQDIRKMNLPYRNYFKLQPGKYRLKFAVSDESNNLGAIEQSLEVPAKPQKGLSVSSLVVMAQKTALPALVQDIQAQLLDDSDPLVYNGMQITPNMNHKLPVGSTIPVLFKIYNDNSSVNQWKLEAKAKLISEKDEESAQSSMELNRTKLALTGSSEAFAALNLTFPDAPPGKYTLRIEISEAGSAGIAITQTDIELDR